MSDLRAPLTAADHVRGAIGAPVVLVEYGDFDCRFCVQAYPVLVALRDRFQDDLAIVFRHNPRGQAGSAGLGAALASEAAAEQGKFWRMHDLLFEHEHALSPADILGHARSLELDVLRFEAAMSLESTLRRVRESQIGGLRSGVVGTPTFFVNGDHYHGRAELAPLAEAIRAAYRTR